MQLEKSPIAHSDEQFLFSLYSSTRFDELALIGWNDEQKQLFLQNQFKSQHNFYFTKYPDASYQLIKINDESVGRIYTAELPDEIRIIDLTILPEFRGKNIGSQLIKEILAEAEIIKKAVQIYLEKLNPAQKLFARLGFKEVSGDEVYTLWRWESNFCITN